MMAVISPPTATVKTKTSGPDGLTFAPLPQILLRELYRAMELCCKEIEDYQGAYQYAAKQLALAER